MQELLRNSYIFPSGLQLPDRSDTRGWWRNCSRSCLVGCRGAPCRGWEDYLEIAFVFFFLERAFGAKPYPGMAKAWGQERQGLGKGEAGFN